MYANHLYHILYISEHDTHRDHKRQSIHPEPIHKINQKEKNDTQTKERHNDKKKEEKKAGAVYLSLFGIT